MIHNGIDYDVKWFNDYQYKQINNKPNCDQFKKETLLVNISNFEYYYCGKILNRPNDNIYCDLQIEYKKHCDNLTIKSNLWIRIINRIKKIYKK